MLDDGSIVSSITYPNLYATLGTSFGSAGQLPDLRGQFIRGLDSRITGNIDTWPQEHSSVARTLGSPQADDFKSHTHTSPPLYAGAAAGGGAMRIVPPWDVGDNGSNTSSNTLTMSSAGGYETRPQNIALTPCIKTD